jgi:hypothetical protein
MRALPLHLQVINQRLAGSQNLRILLRRYRSKRSRTNVGRPLPDHLLLIRESMPLRQRLVDRQVSTIAILHEKSDIGCLIEEQLQHGKAQGKVFAIGDKI